MSIWSRIYNRINWKNYPSVQTPLNEANLNKMDSALYDLDGRVVTLSGNIQNAVTSFNYDEQTGKITVSKFDGSTQVINTNISKIATNWSYNPVTQEMIIEMVDGTETKVLLSDLLSPMEIKDSNTIEHFTDRNGQVWFNIKANSITDSMIEPNYLAKLQEQADKGADYVAESETNMNLSVAAKESSENFSKLSKSYAIGGTGTREGEDTDNAKYYAEQARGFMPEGYSELVTTVDTHTTEISALSENVTQLNDDLTQSEVSQKGLELFGWIAPTLNGVKDEIIDGVYHKKIGRIDLGSLEYGSSSTSSKVKAWYSKSTISNIKIPNESIPANMYIKGFVTKSRNEQYGGQTGDIALSRFGEVIVNNETTPTGILYYEMATEITRDINSANVLDTIGTTTNLLNPTLQSQVLNGITCTNNGDGTFTLNGTATAETRFKVMDCKIPIGNYKFVGCPNGGSTSTYRMYINLNGSDYGNGVMLNLSQEVNQPIIIQVFANVVLNNLVFKPMLTTNLSATYSDFVPYTGSTGKLNSDVAELTKIVKNVVNSGRFLCDVVSNQVNNIKASDISSGAYPSNPARCVYNVSGFYSNIDYNIKILSDSSRFIISPTITQRISISWIELS